MYHLWIYKDASLITDIFVADWKVSERETLFAYDSRGFIEHVFSSDAWTQIRSQVEKG